MRDNLVIPKGKEKLVKEVFEQPGGYRQIEYEGFMVVAPLEHIKYAIAYLSASPDKRGIMKSVNHHLQKKLKRIAKGKASQDEAMEYMKDVGIWFANEVLEGRAVLEESKQ